MANRTAAGTLPVRGAPLWLAAQLVALVATVAVIVGLFAAPPLTLKWLWGFIIPLVPASLLVSPLLWRNVCPLGTLNMLPAGPRGAREVGLGPVIVLSVVGMVLLGVLVAARHVLFNGFNASDGPVLGAVVIAVALLALASGLLFNAKVGFCNSLCPVLPVERLYGQSPLLRNVGNPRCTPCTRCTKTGCIDLSPDRTIPHLLARAPASRPWFLTHYGVFAAAFPGFVLGYFLATDGPFESAPAVFLEVGQWTAASFVLVALLAAVTRMRAEVAMPALAAAAVGLYYWFTGPILSRTLGLDGSTDTALRASPAAVIFRVAAFALVAWWLHAAWSRKGARELAAEAGVG